MYYLRLNGGFVIRSMKFIRNETMAIVDILTSMLFTLPSHKTQGQIKALIALDICDQKNF